MPCSYFFYHHDAIYLGAGEDHCNVPVHVALDLGHVQIRGVPGIGTDAVIVLGDGVKYLLKVQVTSVDATPLVGQLDYGETDPGQGEAGGGRGDVLDHVPGPQLQVLGHQGGAGLDLSREVSRHLQVWTGRQHNIRLSLRRTRNRMRTMRTTRMVRASV